MYLLDKFLAALPHNMLRLRRYKDNHCPSCKTAYRGSYRLPEAPGSLEGKLCYQCGAVWVLVDACTGRERVRKTHG